MPQFRQLGHAFVPKLIIYAHRVGTAHPTKLNHTEFQVARARRAMFLLFASSTSNSSDGTALEYKNPCA